MFTYYCCILLSLLAKLHIIYEKKKYFVMFLCKTINKLIYYKKIAVFLSNYIVSFLSFWNMKSFFL